ncbi:MAG: hypothetical protein K0S79_1403, partial [Nitrospira sp.]|nr:hypothetical protein [Nitrospira sp.]
MEDSQATALMRRWPEARHETFRLRRLKHMCRLGMSKGFDANGHLRITAG